MVMKIVIVIRHLCSTASSSIYERCCAICGNVMKLNVVKNKISSEIKRMTSLSIHMVADLHQKPTDDMIFKVSGPSCIDILKQ